MRKISGIEGAALILSAICIACSAGWLAWSGGGAPAVRVERTPIMTPAPAPSSGSSAEGTEKVNINTADSQTLQTLPGIGAARAEDIIAYREEHGPFRIPEDITQVSGIGEGILEQIIDSITVQ